MNHTPVTRAELKRQRAESLAQEASSRANAKGFHVVVAAWCAGITTANRAPVPEGMVGALAVLNGRDENGHYNKENAKWLLIPRDLYQSRDSFGFVVRQSFPVWPETI
jgi:hypothetical protein